MTEQTSPMPCAVCGGDAELINNSVSHNYFRCGCCINDECAPRVTLSVALDDWNRAQRRILAERHWQALVAALQGSAMQVGVSGGVASELDAEMAVRCAKSIADAAVKR